MKGNAVAIERRRLAALQLAKRRGLVVNADVRELYPDVSSETVRQDLGELVRRGELQRVGEKRGTAYITAEGAR